MPNPTIAPAYATPVYLAPAPGAISKNYPGAAAANQIYLGAGFVSGIYVNTAAATSTIELFDGDPGAGGVSLGKWPTTAIAAFPLALPFATSLWATVTNAPNVTVVYVPSA
jgi:hypothetical protein